MKFTPEARRRFLGLDEPILHRRLLPPFALLLGEVHVSRLEITTCADFEMAGLLRARFELIFDQWGEWLLAPTLPVHDEPVPKGKP